MDPTFIHMDLGPIQMDSYTDGLIYHLVVHDAPTPPGIFAGLYMFHQSHLTGLFPFTFVNEYTTDSLGPLHGSQITFSIFCILRKFNPLELLIDCSDSRTETKAIRVFFFRIRRLRVYETVGRVSNGCSRGLRFLLR
jgi:hypothetical protein